MQLIQILEKGQNVKSQNVESQKEHKKFEKDQDVKSQIRLSMFWSDWKSNFKGKLLMFWFYLWHQKRSECWKSNLSDFQILTTYGISTYGILAFKNQS